MEADLDLLANWPRDRRLGLLALTDQADAPGWRDRVDADPGLAHYWDCASETMFSGPAVEPPFRRALMVDLSDPSAARALVEDLVAGVGTDHATIYAGSAIPAMARRMMSALAAVLRRLPSPTVPAGAPPLDAPRASSEVNPSNAQIEAFLKYPVGAPLMVVNLNLHKDQGIDPDTGAADSGRTIADKYFRRGIRTFSRLGARPAWAGGCRGSVVDGLGFGAFDQIGLIHYASRDDFATLLRIAAAEGWHRYREAGLERSWVVHGRVEASR